MANKETHSQNELFDPILEKNNPASTQESYCPFDVNENFIEPQFGNHSLLQSNSSKEETTKNESNASEPKQEPYCPFYIKVFEVSQQESYSPIKSNYSEVESAKDKIDASEPKQEPYCPFYIKVFEVFQQESYSSIKSNYSEAESAKDESNALEPKQEPYCPHDIDENFVEPQNQYESSSTSMINSISEEKCDEDIKNGIHQQSEQDASRSNFSEQLAVVPNANNSVGFTSNYPHKQEGLTNKNNNFLWDLAKSGQLIQNNDFTQWMSSMQVPSLQDVLRPTAVYYDQNKLSVRGRALGLSGEFLYKNPSIIIDNKFYRYNGMFYVPGNDKELDGQITEEFRDIIAAGGGANLVRDISYFTVRENRIRKTYDDISDNYICLKNGLLDLNTGHLTPHTPAIITLYGINGQYLPGMTAPIFEDFLSSAGFGNPEFSRLVKQMIGCCLTPDIKPKRIFVIQGKSNTGKSVLVNLIQKLLEPYGYFTIDAHELSEKFALSELPGRVCFFCSDMPSTPLNAKAVSKAKQISGGDIISSDQKHKERVVFRSRAKLILVTNHKLLTQTADNAFFERIIVIPFANQVPRDKMDINLLEKLYFEKDAIITTCLNEYMRIRADAHMRDINGFGGNYLFSGGFALNQVIEEGEVTATSLHELVKAFVDTYTEPCPDMRINTRDAYDLFSQVYGVYGEDSFNRAYSEYIREKYRTIAISSRGPKNGSSNGPRGFKGIRIKPPLLI